jgi:LysM repeat protein
MKKFLMFALAASVISNTSFAASYVIQPGDTLQGVAYKFGVSYNELMKANPSLDPDSIKYGFRIEIPERTVVQNQRVIHIVNPVPKHQPKPQPYAMQHTTPTGPTITIVEEDTVY